MRFSAPRSLSPSPVRQKSRKSSTFGVQSDSDDNSNYDSDSGSYTDTDSDSGSVPSSSSSDSFCYASESEVPPPPQKPKHTIRDIAEQRHIEDTVAAIRLRTRHHDYYEEWEKQTRKDAFRTARKQQTVTQSKLHDEQDKARSHELQRLASLHARQAAEVQAKLESLRVQQQNEEKRLREGWKARERRLRDRIEAVIRFEEEKVRVRLEAERKEKEEEERQRKEEELKRRLAEEKRKQEEEKKRKEEEEAQRRKDEQRKKEENEKRQRLEDERNKAERLQAEQEQRKTAGLTTADADWRHARHALQQLKTGSMKTVKSNKELKSAWSSLRRQITPKVGQITNDQAAISRIVGQIQSIMQPSPPHSPQIYYPLLSSLSKAILLQAETEVTAEKRSAGPLAQVTYQLLDSLSDFPEIFFAKLVQRAGGWPIPSVIPPADHDNTPWKDEAERVKAMGYRKSGNGDGLESAAEYSTRVAGIMRVYFHILKIPVGQRPLPPMFQLPRYWSWFARIVGENGLLETAVAPQIIYVALDVLGIEAKDLWGHQWIKMLALVYEGVTTGLGNGRVVGGNSPEGKAARVRVQLEVERIVSGVR